MLKCREVARLIASDELTTASWSRRLEVRLHLFMCQHCRRYAAQIRALGRSVRNIWAHRLEDPVALERLTGKILSRPSMGGGPTTHVGEGEGEPNP